MLHSTKFPFKIVYTTFKKITNLKNQIDIAFHGVIYMEYLRMESNLHW